MLVLANCHDDLEACTCLHMCMYIFRVPPDRLSKHFMIANSRALLFISLISLKKSKWLLVQYAGFWKDGEKNTGVEESLWVLEACLMLLQGTVASKSCCELPELHTIKSIGLLAIQWEILKTYSLSANAFSALFSTCCNDTLYFIPSLEMSLNL